jgi:hypothetical protein
MHTLFVASTKRVFGAFFPCDPQGWCRSLRGSLFVLSCGLNRSGTCRKKKQFVVSQSDIATMDSIPLWVRGL